VFLLPFTAMAFPAPQILIVSQTLVSNLSALLALPLLTVTVILALQTLTAPLLLVSKKSASHVITQKKDPTATQMNAHQIHNALLALV
jgi:hypothetical protein